MLTENRSMATVQYNWKCKKTETSHTVEKLINTAGRLEQELSEEDNAEQKKDEQNYCQRRGRRGQTAIQSMGGLGSSISLCQVLSGVAVHQSLHQTWFTITVVNLWKSAHTYLLWASELGWESSLIPSIIAFPEPKSQSSSEDLGGDTEQQVQERRAAESCIFTCSKVPESSGGEGNDSG